MKNAERKKNIILILIIGWLVPGSGYLFFGKWWKGIAFFFLLFFMYFAGMEIGEFRNVSYTKESHYLVLQIFAGIFTLIALLVTFSLDTIPIWCYYSYYIGCLYTSLVSLLNLLILAKTYILWKEQNETLKSSIQTKSP